MNDRRMLLAVALMTGVAASAVACGGDDSNVTTATCEGLPDGRCTLVYP